MPKSYLNNVLPANIVIESKQFPIRSTNSIQYSVDYNLNYFIIDQNESSMYKAQINCKVTIMGLLFNFLRRTVKIRYAFFILFCLFGSAEAFAQIIIIPPSFIKAPSTTTITSSVNPSIAGQPVLLTATITSSAQATPTGTVHFYDNTTNTDLTPAGVAISNGKATFTTAVLTVNASFTATYSGDNNFLPSTSVAFTQTVTYPVITITPTFYLTTTTLVSNTNPTVAGSQPVTFTATVSSFGNVNVTGIVDFWDNTNNQNLTPGGIPVIDGIATFTTSSLPFGDLNITAIYRGDANGNQQSTSNILIQRVQLNITGIGITLTSSSTGNTSNWGIKVTFTATVSTGVGAPSGIVTFTDNGYLLGYATMDASGNASLATKLLTPGSHSITASYFSISSVLTQNVTPGYPTIFVGQGTGMNHSNIGIIHSNPGFQNSQALFNYGQPITFAVNILGDGINIPTGNVSFIDGIDPQNLINLGTIGLDETGNGFFTTSILSIGSHLIYAVYSGNDIYLEDSSNASSDVNTKGNKFNDVDALVISTSTSTSISSSRNPSVAGQQITFTATVASPYPESNALVPGGTVIFNIDGIDQDPAPLSGNGVKAFLDISSLSIGSHIVKATYLGDGNYKASSSGSITQVVEPVGSAILYFIGFSQTTPVNTVFPNSLMFDIININPKLVGGASVTFTGAVRWSKWNFLKRYKQHHNKNYSVRFCWCCQFGTLLLQTVSAGTYTVTATIPGFGTGTFTMTNTSAARCLRSRSVGVYRHL
jgi:hypothetical protein